jgi:hypothetical protein
VAHPHCSCRFVWKFCLQREGKALPYLTSLSAFPPSQLHTHATTGTTFLHHGRFCVSEPGRLNPAAPRGASALRGVAQITFEGEARRCSRGLASRQFPGAVDRGHDHRFWFVTLRFLDSSLLITCAGDCELLTLSVEQLFVSELAHSTVQVMQLSEAFLHMHLYHLHEEGPSGSQRIDGIANGACRILDLPAQSLEGLWDSYVCGLAGRER